MDRTIITSLSTGQAKGARYYLHSPNVRTWDYEQRQASIQAARHPLDRER